MAEISYRCIHKLVEEEAARTPEAVALVHRGIEVTYGELNSRANRLAHRLIAEGAGAETLVAVAVERSPAMVVALLAVLKAGAAYLPLDTAFPRERLDFMMQDSDARLLLASHRAAELFDTSRVRVLDPDENRSAPSTNPLADVTPENRAYVTYTSGSSGKPKASEIPHRAITGYALGVEYASFDRAQTFLQYSSVSWDALTLELWTPLIQGARCVLFAGNTSPEEILRAAHENGVTFLFLPTALFNLIVDTMPDALEGIPQVATGGEASSPDHIQRALSKLRRTRLIHVYGPSECTVFATSYLPRPGELFARSVPIGKPVGDRRVYVLDSRMRRAAAGVQGELCIGGNSLARGYLNRPELTAEMFLPDPFSETAGARLYRTGDIVRYLPDGNLEYLYRNDRQVKVRGFRVELPEIEAVLMEHPAVREAAVVLRGETASTKQIVAYVAPRSDHSPDIRNEGAQNYVDAWRDVFNERIYDLKGDAEEPLFNTVGWKSTSDGSRIPLEEMRAWAGDIKRQALAGNPRRVLEIGCGSGMLLFGIAPSCEAYYGTDISQSSLQYVRSQIARNHDEYAHVTLRRQAADDWSGIPEAFFDLVILSSVVQYFPSSDYLASVVEKALGALRPGGTILFADIRNLSLLPVFHASVQLHQADGDLDCAALREQVRKQIEHEPELCIDPRFFAQLPVRFPAIEHVQIRLQRGSVANELTKYRYSALLHIGEPQRSPETVPEVFNGRHELGAVAKWLCGCWPEVGVLSGISNLRLESDSVTARLLHSPLCPATVEGLRLAAEEASLSGVDPNALYELAEDNGYDVEIGWSLEGADRFDAVLVRRMPAGAEGRFAAPIANTRATGELANRPLAARAAAGLIPSLREHLKQRLPDYMIPGAFVVLESLPRTTTNKIDRKALPEPDRGSSVPATVFTGPSTPLEEVIAGTCGSLLGRDRIDIREDFFEIGGHSLLAAQVIARLKKIFRADIPLRTIFESPTVEGLAAAIVRHEGRPGQMAAIAKLKLQVERMPAEDVRSLLLSRQAAGAAD